MLNYDDIIRDSNFHEWKKYAPLDVQYLKYAESDPSLVAVGHKIEDVYQRFAMHEHHLYLPIQKILETLQEMTISVSYI